MSNDKRQHNCGKDSPSGRRSGRRRGIFPVLGLVSAVWLLRSTPLVGGQIWPVAQAPGSIRLECAKKTPWPAKVGHAQVWPSGLDPLLCNAAVFSASGRPAGARIIWAAKGEPLKLMFDTSSGEPSYDLYLYEGPPLQAPAWQPEAGVLLETRRLKDGSVNTWDQAWRQYQLGEPVLGRSVVSNIFLGIHPHGATTNFAGHYNAWLLAKKPGAYALALVSTGPAYLRVDDRVVVARPALGGSRGRRAEYNATVNLTAGPHHLEFLFFHHGDGEWMAEAAWKPPEGRGLFEPIPQSAFVPCARFDTFSWTHAPAKSDKASFEWEMAEHSLVGGWAMVSVQFRTIGGRKDLTSRWEFDDGTTTTGSPVLHAFPRMGLHQVRYLSDPNGPAPSSLTDQILVHPNWSQLEEWRDDIFARQQKQLLASDLSAMPPEDLAALVEFADAISAQPLLSHAGAACLRRQAAFKPSQAEIFSRLARHYQTAEVRDYVSAEKCWRASLALAAEESSLKQRTRIGLARLLTDAFNKPAEALDLLKTMRTDYLTSETIRQTEVAKGDALAAQGKVEEAAKVYRLAGGSASPAYLLHSVQSAARLETARDLLQRAEYDAAEEIIRQIESETPSERLSPQTGLPMILVHLGRKEYPLALSRCQRLLYSATVDAQQAQVLYYLAETELALGREDAAQDTLKKLFKEHPYSEAAARAKDRWGGRLGPAKK